MKEQFTTTVRVAGKGESKSRAFADALNHVQAAVMKSSSRILLRIEPQDVTVVHAREAVRKEAFLFFFLRRERRTYSVERHACFMPPPRRGWGRFEPWAS